MLPVSHCFLPFLSVSHRFSLFLIVSHGFTLFLIASHGFSSWVFALLALLVWWARGSGGPVGLVGFVGRGVD